jgi:hypothetical protein
MEKYSTISKGGVLMECRWDGHGGEDDDDCGEDDEDDNAVSS